MKIPHVADETFATTRWSLVRRAGGSAPGARRALGELCEAYWRPIYAWLRRDGHPPDDALDLTQDFLAAVLERGALGAPDSGRFRGYVIGAVRHFAHNARRRDRAARRGGEHTRLDGEDGERWLHGVVASRDLGPEATFERGYAVALLERAMRALQREFEHKGAGERFAAIRPFLDGHDAATSYAEVAAALCIEAGTLRVGVHRARTRLGELIRAEVAETVDDPALVEDELAALRAALA